MIAAHFGRERSTVIRWASDRGMPVHRIPGKGRGSVYALTNELDAWLAQTDPDAPAPAAMPVPGIAETARHQRAKPRRLQAQLAMAAGAACLVAAGAYAWRSPEPAGEIQTVPANAKTASLYLDARSDWAQRTPAAITSAIGKLERVIAADPGFAPAYAALADSYILAREFGSLPDLDAFARAQAAVDAGLRIQQRQPDLLRAQGFLDYWWRGDREAARNSFETALALAPEAAQTHFWYGNVLIDNGDFAEGLARFNRARLLEPGSAAIEADLAWALWSSGKDKTARDMLIAVGKRHPDLAVVPDYLSVMQMAQGNLRGFVDEVKRMVKVRQKPQLERYADDLEAKLGEGGSALADFMIDEALAEADRGERATLTWPAFIASSTGDRARLIAILDKAAARKERWGSAGLRDRIARKWAKDATVMAKLEPLKALPMKPRGR